MCQTSDIRVSLVFKTNHNTWEVKEQKPNNRWRCESRDGRKYSFLEEDILQALNKEKT